MSQGPGTTSPEPFSPSEPSAVPLRLQRFPLCPSCVFKVSLHPSALSPAQMQSLIKAAQEHDVEFIFAISAGQDIVFSSAGDRLLLQQKLRQVPWAIPSPHGS